VCLVPFLFRFALFLFFFSPFLRVCVKRVSTPVVGDFSSFLFYPSPFSVFSQCKMDDRLFSPFYPDVSLGAFVDPRSSRSSEGVHAFFFRFSALSRLPLWFPNRSRQMARASFHFFLALHRRFPPLVFSHDAGFLGFFFLFFNFSRSLKANPLVTPETRTFSVPPFFDFPFAIFFYLFVFLTFFR